MRGVERGRRRLRQLGAGHVGRLQAAAFAEPEDVAVEGVAAGLGQDVDRAAREPPVLGVQAAGLDLDFLHEVEVQRLAFGALSIPVVFRPSMMYWFSALVDPLNDGP